MSDTPAFTDIRLIPLAAQHHAALMSTDPVAIAQAVTFIVKSYEHAPPMTDAQAVIWTETSAWWQQEIADL